MNSFLKFFLLILISLSLIFLAYNIQNKIQYLKNKKYFHSNFIKNNDYNEECPDTNLISKKGEIFRLSDFNGSVILLRFTSFSKSDISRLVFLDHLYEAHKSENFIVFFIHLKPKNSIKKSYNSLKFLSPIIENDINISNLFKPKRNAIIIIDKEFRIKFHQNFVRNTIINNQVKRFLCLKNSIYHLNNQKFNLNISKVHFKNIENGSVFNLDKAIFHKSSLITTLISTCITCSEHKRIIMLKELAILNILPKEQIYLLFGKRNNSKIISEYTKRYELINYMTIGIVEDTNELSKDEYFSLFKLELNPCTYFINNNGKILFEENINNSPKVNINTIKRLVNE